MLSKVWNEIIYPPLKFGNMGFDIHMILVMNLFMYSLIVDRLSDFEHRTDSISLEYWKWNYVMSACPKGNNIGLTNQMTVQYVRWSEKHLALRWRHNGHESVSNHQPYDCLLNRLSRRRSKKTSKLRVTGLCAGNSPGTGEFPAQMASNAENVSIWWRHHGLPLSVNLLCIHQFKSQMKY